MSEPSVVYDFAAIAKRATEIAEDRARAISAADPVSEAMAGLPTLIAALSEDFARALKARQAALNQRHVGMCETHKVFVDSEMAKAYREAAQQNCNQQMATDWSNGAWR